MASDNDRETRINEIRERVQQLAGGKMVAWESANLPADLREAFWRQILAFEIGPFTTTFAQLTAAGIELSEGGYALVLRVLRDRLGAGGVGRRISGLRHAREAEAAVRP
jgi:hypothetical protein